MLGLFSGSAATLALSWALYFLVTTALFVAFGFAFERSPFGRARQIFSLPRKAGQLGHEALGNARFIALGAGVFSLAVARGWVHPTRAGLWPGVVTFLLCFVGFELYFYGFHRALHTRALWRFHRWHHHSVVTSPLSGQSLSGVEALGWLVGSLLVPMALSRVGALSAAGFLTYFTFNAWANIVGHSNAEAMPRDAGLRAKSWFVHPYLFHTLHHARSKGHYGLGTTVLDRALGTEWAEWPSLHIEVIEGRPLGSLPSLTLAHRPRDTGG